MAEPLMFAAPALADKPDARPPLGLPTRLAALLLAYDGRVAAEECRQIAREAGLSGHNHGARGQRKSGSLAGDRVYRAMKKLARLDLITRVGDDYVALCLPDLADWLADSVAAHVNGSEEPIDG